MLLSVGAVAALMLAACSSGGGGEDTQTSGGDAGGSTGGGGGEPLAADCEMAESIDFLVPTYSDKTKALWDEVIAGFEAENAGTKVNLEIQSWENINDVVRTKIQADQMPDLLSIDSFAAYAEDEMLYPVADVMSPERVADFQESFVENASMDGVQYGLPLIASARTMFYNKDLFEKAGLDADNPPKTWDELRAAAEKISALEGGTYGYGLPLGNEEAQAETAIWMFGNGGGYGDAEELTITTDENVEAVEFFQKLAQDGLTQPDAGASQRTPLMDVFIQGKIGMIVGLPPTVNEIEAKNPELNYGMAPIATKDGSPVTLGVADHMMAFDKGDETKQCALRAFLDYYYQPDVYSNWVDAEGFVPVTKSGAEVLGDKEALAPFIELLPAAQFYPFTNPDWPAAQGAIQSLIGQVAQGKDARETLEEIAAKAES